MLQMLQHVLAAIVDRTLTACNHNAAWCRGCL